jgi:hypothetical protein
MSPGVMKIPEPTTAPMTRKDVSRSPSRLRNPGLDASSTAMVIAMPIVRKILSDANRQLCFPEHFSIREVMNA